MFGVIAPAKIVFRDFSIKGPSGGGGITFEVNDIASSRVHTEEVAVGSFKVSNIGNVPFEMRDFQNNPPFNPPNPPPPSVITGNGASGTGYFAYFGGGATNLKVGGGTNLVIQDSWHEGNDSSYVTCSSGDAAMITIENTHIAMGRGDDTKDIPSKFGSVNVDGCNTNTSIVASDLYRAQSPNIAPLYSIRLTSLPVHKPGLHS